MPYITQNDRIRLAEHPFPERPGELNYLISLLLRRYWTKSARDYRAINDIVGAIEGAKAEFQRQIVNPYEDRKIKENGGLYE
jgi:hypothetical protein